MLLLGFSNDLAIVATSPHAILLISCLVLAVVSLFGLSAAADKVHTCCFSSIIASLMITNASKESAS